MPDTFTQLLIQLVFAVKGRQNMVKESFRNELEKYMCGIARNKSHKPLSIYCMPDHLHFLIGLHPSLSISDLVKMIKTSSTDFINEKKFLRTHFQWQQGYGAFSYSRSQLDNVVKYILNQPKHHKKETFREEYLKFFKNFEVEFEEKFLFEFYD